MRRYAERLKAIEAKSHDVELGTLTIIHSEKHLESIKWDPEYTTEEIKGKERLQTVWRDDLKKRKRALHKEVFRALMKGVSAYEIREAVNLGAENARKEYIHEG